MKAQQLEQTARTAIYFVLNAKSLIQMESGYTAVNLLTQLHNYAQEGANDAQAEAESEKRSKSYYLLQIIHEMQCLLELVARKKLGQQSGWRCVLIIELFKFILNFLRRPGMFAAMRRRLSGLLRAPPVSKGNTRFVIPRISTTERSATNVWDGALALLELLYLVRPVLFAYLAMRQGGLSWTLWQGMFFSEATAVLMTAYIQRNATPILYEVPPEQVAVESPLADRIRLLSLYFVRDPFFSFVLRDPIKDYLTEGGLARIPLLGFLISNMTNYCLAMQRKSYLFTAGS